MSSAVSTANSHERMQVILISLTALGGLALFILLFSMATESDEPTPTAVASTAPAASAEDVQAKILKALADNRASQLRDLIKTNHFDPDEPIGEHDSTLMIMATEQRKWECVKALFEAGADPDLPDKNGATPIMFAVATNNIHIARFLLDHHVDTSRTVKDPRTKKHRALRSLARTDEMNALLDQFNVP